MEIIQETTDFRLDVETAVAIGKFDGVHIGHRRLLEEIIKQKKRGLAACVFTFDPAPTVFFGLSDGRELTTREEKRQLFARMGVDILIEFPMNGRTAAIPAESFVRDILARRMRARLIAAGRDLSFGAGGEGDVALLERLSGEGFYEPRIIEKVCLDGVEISSTYIRCQVEQGDMERARRMLGSPYTVLGRVVHGSRIGRTLGFPTVNLLPTARKLLPPAGVYYSRVLYKGTYYRAITNVGCKPTVSDASVMGVESYLYDFDAEIYEEDIEVELLKFRRPERRFPDAEALRVQLREDILAGKNYQWQDFLRA